MYGECTPFTYRQKWINPGLALTCSDAQNARVTHINDANT